MSKLQHSTVALRLARTPMVRGFALCALVLSGCHADWDEPGEGTDAGGATPIVMGDSGANNNTSNVAMDGSAPDGSPSATPADGGVPDAAPMSSIDAAIPGFCNSINRGSSTLCTDLELGPLTNAAGAFDWVDEPNSPVLVNEGKASGPRVMKSILTATNSEEGRRAMWGVEKNPKTLVAAFDILPAVDVMADGALVTVYKAQQTVESTKPAPDGGMRERFYPGIALNARNTGVTVSIANSNGTEPPTFDEFPIQDDIPSGWFRVTVETKYGAAGSVTVKYDDKVVFSRTNILIYENPTADTYHQLGLYSYGSKTAGSALYDNILLDATY